MKKKFVALLISAAMVSGSLALPVYAAEEETAIEFADDEEDIVDVEEEAEEQEDTDVLEIPDDTWEDFSDQPVTEDFSSESEAVGTSTTIGGNINWGSSNSILPTDVTTVKTGRMFLGIKGSYITDMQNALNRINAIRKEACEEGIKDPRNESRNLTSSDYVPIKWSSDLEYIARIRAAEASVYRQHIRLNGYDAFAIYSPNGVRSWGEVLAWNTSRTFLQGIEQWYREKKDWVGNTGKVTGHYTQMIDPDNIYVGLATFINPNAGYSTTTAGEFTSQGSLDYSQGTSGAALDESAGPAIDNCIQTVEVKTNKITASMPELNSLAAPNSVQAEFDLTVYNCKMETLGATKWISSDVKTAAVDNTGKVTGVHEGSAEITATCGDFSATKTIQVTGHPNTELKNAKEATCSTEGYTGDKICKDCGKTIEAGKTIPKKEHSWDAGKITKEAACETKGVKTYTCETCKKTGTEEIPARGHKFGAWVTTSQADVISPAKQTRTCTVCGKKEQRNYGSRLRGTMTVNISSIPLKTRQKTSVLKVTGLAKGDSITSWKSSNTKVAKVAGRANGTCTITAGNKTGKAKITITLKSGLQKTVTVSVQKSAVKTKKISGVAKTLRLNRKQKTTLKPVLSPLTSTEKITYKSSNSKVASVNSKGQITAKKKGTTVITVKSGTKTVKCKVTVK